jgi:hypothetical protein
VRKHSVSTVGARAAKLLILSILAASVMLAGLGVRPVGVQASAYPRDDPHQFALAPAVVGRHARQIAFEIVRHVKDCPDCFLNSAAGSVYPRDGFRVASSQWFRLAPVNHAMRDLDIEVSVFDTIAGARDVYSWLAKPSGWVGGLHPWGAWSGPAYPSFLLSGVDGGYTDALVYLREGNIVIGVDVDAHTTRRALLPSMRTDARRVGSVMAAVVAWVRRRGGFPPTCQPQRKPRSPCRL